MMWWHLENETCCICFVALNMMIFHIFITLLLLYVLNVFHIALSSEYIEGILFFHAMTPGFLVLFDILKFSFSQISRRAKSFST